MSKNFKLTAVIETPKGCRNKYVYDHKLGIFRLKKILPEGMVFPYNFGFIPDTISDDGDPSDILVLMDESAFPGCFVDVRVVGILKAKVIEKNEKDAKENPRFFGIAEESNLYDDIENIEDFGRKFLEEVEHFFINYSALSGKKFIPQGWYGKKEAWDCFEEFAENFQQATN